MYIAKRYIGRGLIIASAAIAIFSPPCAWSQALISNQMPLIEVVGVGGVHRLSENKDKAGLLLPPWTKVEIANVFGFKTQPRANSRAMFVPIDVDLEPFELNVKSSTIQDGCDKSSAKWWSVDFQEVYDRRVFDVKPLSGRSEEFPFDVVVIYPSVSAARQIPKSQIRAEMLPRGVKLTVVKAAVDVTGDGSPDIVITEYLLR
jgi:hypothetical protein